MMNFLKKISILLLLIIFLAFFAYILYFFLFPEVLVDMGKDSYKNGEYAESLKCYDRALNIFPSYYSTEHAWYYRGCSLYELKRYEEALMSFDEALVRGFHEDNSIVALIWLKKGLSFSALGRYSYGIICFNKALSLDTSLKEAEEFRKICEDSLKKSGIKD